MTHASTRIMNVADLWYSTQQCDWDQALERYWHYVQPRNLELERALDEMDIKRLRGLCPRGWYDFLHDEYFRWKYTAPNRYATTTIQLKKYLDNGELDALDNIRKQLLTLDCSDIRRGLITAKNIRGLGTAGASGLLSLIYPSCFATVDQFVVKALRLVPGLSDADDLSQMAPDNLRVSDGVKLIRILTQKANDNNRTFGSSTWTTRKIDMILWTYGR